MVIAPDLPSPGNELEHRGRGGGCLETDKVDSIDVVGVINCKEMFIFMVVVDVVVVVVVFCRRCCCCRFFSSNSWSRYGPVFLLLLELFSHKKTSIHFKWRRNMFELSAAAAAAAVEREEKEED